MVDAESKPTYEEKMIVPPWVLYNAFVVTQCQVTQGSKSFFAKMSTEYYLINT